MKILMISRYAEPQPVGTNNIVFRQASSLNAMPGISVEVLTWPFNRGWNGSMPARAASHGPRDVPYLVCERAGLTYHVVVLPGIWNDRVLIDTEWAAAVDTGMRLLEKVQPSVVHLQQWIGLWWMLEAAQRLGIPAVYTSHDWGLACLRTVLVTGWDRLCDGVVQTDKCMACIFAGRNLIGKANEAVASLPIGEQVLQHLYGTRIRNALMARGVVRIGLEKRVGLALERAHRVLSSVQALVTLSSFGRTFFGQLGVPNERMHVLPWYYDPPALPPAQSASKAGELVVGYIGRLSPEKGVHVLLEAISIVQSTQPIRLLIAGAVDNQYATALHRRYPDRIGKHSVEWLGWMPHAEIARFFNQVDIVAMPSLGMDNTPGTLLESYSFRCPVIATDLPSLRDLVQDGVNGFLFPLGDTQALSQAIRRIAAAPDIIPQLSRNIPNVLSSGEYTAKLAEIYREIA